jgi:hypothetical protein
MKSVVSSLVASTLLSFATFAPAFGQASAGGYGGPLASCTADQAKFKAWKNMMPIQHSVKLIVIGEVTCPTPKWKVRLVEAKPQGVNPAILILNIVARKPPGNAADVRTPVQVRFEKAKGGDYQQVTIRGAGPDFTIPIQLAQ